MFPKVWADGDANNFELLLWMKYAEKSVRYITRSAATAKSTTRLSQNVSVNLQLLLRNRASKLTNSAK